MHWKKEGGANYLVRKGAALTIKLHMCRYSTAPAVRNPQQKDPKNKTKSIKSRHDDSTQKDTIQT